MAIVELGTLRIYGFGDNPVAYNGFQFQDDRAYVIFAEFQASDFDNTFSTVFIYPKILIGGQELGTWSEAKSLEIQPFQQFFYLPFSTLIGGDSECVLYAIRVSKIYGGSDGAQVSLRLFYDDNVSTKTWLS